MPQAHPGQTGRTMWFNRLAARQLHFRGLSRESLTDFSVRSGISRSTLHDIEHGFGKNITFPVLLKLCNAHGASPDCMTGFDLVNGYVRTPHEGPLVELYRNGPTRQQTASGVPVLCPECGTGRVSTRDHTQMECVTVLWEQGKSVEHLATRFRVSVPVIRLMISEELDLREKRISSGVFTDDLRPLIGSLKTG